MDTNLGLVYKSPSQKARVITESWVGGEIRCPSCFSSLRKFENNNPAADFYCKKCSEEYELKSKKNSMGEKIVDGAYSTMMERLISKNNPNLFLLNYNPSDYSVLNFLVVPKHFFVTDLIEKRKPLSLSAKRAGWIGCNISLRQIPSSGKIYYIKDKKVQPEKQIVKLWKNTLFLRDEKNVATKGWVLDVMKCVDELGKSEFSLDEVYAFEAMLKAKHPDNKHVKDKIRQQLQKLRDKGYLYFTARGKYKRVQVL